MLKQEPKTCPFCGGEAVIVQKIQPSKGSPRWSIGCETFKCIGGWEHSPMIYLDAEEAILIWNKRPGQSEKPKAKFKNVLKQGQRQFKQKRRKKVEEDEEGENVTAEEVEPEPEPEPEEVDLAAAVAAAPRTTGKKALSEAKEYANKLLPPNYACPKCGEPFYSVSFLNDHMEAKHFTSVTEEEAEQFKIKTEHAPKPHQAVQANYERVRSAIQAWAASKRKEFTARDLLALDLAPNQVNYITRLLLDHNDFEKAGYERRGTRASTKYVLKVGA